MNTYKVLNCDDGRGYRLGEQNVVQLGDMGLYHQADANAPMPYTPARLRPTCPRNKLTGIGVPAEHLPPLPPCPLPKALKCSVQQLAVRAKGGAAPTQLHRSKSRIQEQRRAASSLKSNGSMTGRKVHQSRSCCKATTLPDYLAGPPPAGPPVAVCQKRRQEQLRGAPKPSKCSVHHIDNDADLTDISVMGDTSSLLQIVQKSVDSTMQSYYLHTMEKIEGISARLLQNECMLCKMYMGIIERLSKQNKITDKQFKELYDALLQKCRDGLCLQEFEKTGCDNNEEDKSSCLPDYDLPQSPRCQSMIQLRSSTSGSVTPKGWCEQRKSVMAVNKESGPSNIKSHCRGNISRSEVDLGVGPELKTNCCHRERPQTRTPILGNVSSDCTSTLSRSCCEDALRDVEKVLNNNEDTEKWSADQYREVIRKLYVMTKTCQSQCQCQCQHALVDNFSQTEFNATPGQLNSVCQRNSGRMEHRVKRNAERSMELDTGSSYDNRSYGSCASTASHRSTCGSSTMSSSASRKPTNRQRSTGGHKSRRSAADSANKKSKLCSSKKCKSTSESPRRSPTKGSISSKSRRADGGVSKSQQKSVSKRNSSSLRESKSPPKSKKSRDRKASDQNASKFKSASDSSQRSCSLNQRPNTRHQPEPYYSSRSCSPPKSSSSPKQSRQGSIEEPCTSESYAKRCCGCSSSSKCPGSSGNSNSMKWPPSRSPSPIKQSVPSNSPINKHCSRSPAKFSSDSKTSCQSTMSVAQAQEPSCCNPIETVKIEDLGNEEFVFCSKTKACSKCSCNQRQEIKTVERKQTAAAGGNDCSNVRKENTCAKESRKVDEAVTPVVLKPLTSSPCQPRRCNEVSKVITSGAERKPTAAAGSNECPKVRTENICDKKPSKVDEPLTPVVLKPWTSRPCQPRSCNEVSKVITSGASCGSNRRSSCSSAERKPTAAAGSNECPNIRKESTCAKKTSNYDEPAKPVVLKPLTSRPCQPRQCNEVSKVITSRASCGSNSRSSYSSPLRLPSPLNKSSPMTSERLITKMEYPRKECSRTNVDTKMRVPDRRCPFSEGETAEKHKGQCSPKLCGSCSYHCLDSKSPKQTCPHQKRSASSPGSLAFGLRDRVARVSECKRFNEPRRLGCAENKVDRFQKTQPRCRNSSDQKTMNSECTKKPIAATTGDRRCRSYSADGKMSEIDKMRAILSAPANARMIDGQTTGPPGSCLSYKSMLANMKLITNKSIGRGIELNDDSYPKESKKPAKRCCKKSSSDPSKNDGRAVSPSKGSSSGQEPSNRSSTSQHSSPSRRSVTVMLEINNETHTLPTRENDPVPSSRYDRAHEQILSKQRGSEREERSSSPQKRADSKESARFGTSSKAEKDMVYSEDERAGSFNGNEAVSKASCMFSDSMKPVKSSFNTVFDFPDASSSQRQSHSKESVKMVGSPRGSERQVHSKECRKREDPRSRSTSPVKGQACHVNRRPEPCNDFTDKRQKQQSRSSGEIQADFRGAAQCADAMRKPKCCNYTTLDPLDERRTLCAGRRAMQRYKSSNGAVFNFEDDEEELVGSKQRSSSFSSPVRKEKSMFGFHDSCGMDHGSEKPCSSRSARQHHSQYFNQATTSGFAMSRSENSCGSQMRSTAMHYAELPSSKNQPKMRIAGSVYANDYCNDLYNQYNDPRNRDLGQLSIINADNLYGIPTTNSYQGSCYSVEGQSSAECQARGMYNYSPCPVPCNSAYQLQTIPSIRRHHNGHRNGSRIKRSPTPLPAARHYVRDDDDITDYESSGECQGACHCEYQSHGNMQLTGESGHALLIKSSEYSTTGAVSTKRGDSCDAYARNSSPNPGGHHDYVDAHAHPKRKIFVETPGLRAGLFAAIDRKANENARNESPSTSTPSCFGQRTYPNSESDATPCGHSWGHTNCRSHSEPREKSSIKGRRPEFEYGEEAYEDEYYESDVNEGQ